MKSIISLAVVFVGTLLIQSGEGQMPDTLDSSAMDHLLDFLLLDVNSELKALGYSNYTIPNISEKFSSIFGGVELRMYNATFTDPATIARKGPATLISSGGTNVSFSAEVGLDVFQLNVGNFEVRTYPIDLGLIGNGPVSFVIGSNKMLLGLTVTTVGQNCTVSVNEARVVSFGGVKLTMGGELLTNYMAEFLVDQVPKLSMARKLIEGFVNPAMKVIVNKVVQMINICSL